MRMIRLQLFLIGLIPFQRLRWRIHNHYFGPAIPLD